MAVRHLHLTERYLIVRAVRRAIKGSGMGPNSRLNGPEPTIPEKYSAAATVCASEILGTRVLINECVAFFTVDTVLTAIRRINGPRLRISTGKLPESGA